MQWLFYVSAGVFLVFLYRNQKHDNWSLLRGWMRPRVATVSPSEVAVADADEQPVLRVVMSPRQYHQRHVAKFRARERERQTAGTPGTRYLTEARAAVYRKHAAGKVLTRDDLLLLAPIRKLDAGKLYDQAVAKPDSQLSDAEFVERYRKRDPVLSPS